MCRFLCRRSTSGERERRREGRPTPYRELRHGALRKTAIWQYRIQLGNTYRQNPLGFRGDLTPTYSGKVLQIQGDGGHSLLNIVSAN